jgi:hypothetical protein
MLDGYGHELLMSHGTKALTVLNLYISCSLGGFALARITDHLMLMIGGFQVCN